MSTTPVYGFQSQLGIDSSNPVTKRQDFQSSTLGLDEEFIDTNGLRGTRSRSVERERQGVRRVDGNIRMQPTAVELSEILQWFLGGTPTGTPTVTYPLADTIPSRTVQIDKVTKVMTYATCYCGRATISGSQGEPLNFDLDVLGLDESEGNSGTFPSLSLDTANAPFCLFDCVVQVNSTTYLARDVTITIDNVIDRNRFYNSQTLTAVVAMDRHIGVNLTLPAGDAMAVYGLGAGGTQVVVTATNGGAVLTMTFVKVVFPRKPIAVDRGEILLPMVGTAMKSGSTLELVTTLNPGP